MPTPDKENGNHRISVVAASVVDTLRVRRLWRLLPAPARRFARARVVKRGLIGQLRSMAMGQRPSRKFDPAFYLDRYEDVVAAGMDPLRHYTDYGAREGRRAVPAVDRLTFPSLPQRQQATVLVLVHEASRTGAPVLAWNIARRLSDSYNVVTVLMRGGELEQDFADVSAATVGPMVLDEWHCAEMKRVAERLVSDYNPLYAVANSIETHLLVPELAKLDVPSVALVHEFAGYIRPLAKMQEVFDWAAHVVFPAELVARSSYEVFPSLAGRRSVHVLSQGRAELPEMRSIKASNKSTINYDAETLSLKRQGKAENRFVVLGLGTVHIRKGVDLFLTVAGLVKKLAPDLCFTFVWIGAGYDPVNDTNYSVYIAEQLIRSGLSETVSILEAVEDLTSAYNSADIFFMSSRLDPQPNVGIDALTRGIPTVCFEGASGTAEILSADPETRSLVVPYLDTQTAAETICRIARDHTELAAIKKAIARVGKAAYDMDAYISQIDGWGRAAASGWRAEE